MNKAKKVVLAFMNSAERYFHTKRIIEEQVKQPRGVFGPMSDRPERWDYTDIRDITKCDLDNILRFAITQLDQDLYNAIPSVALNAALECAIHNFDKGRFQSKINSQTYIVLYNILKNLIKTRGI